MRNRLHPIWLRQHYSLTSAGWFYFLFMFMLLAAAMSSGHNLLYLIVCLFFGCFIAMGNVAVINLRHLQVSRNTPDYIHAEVRTPIEIKVTHNRRLMDSFSLEVHELFPKGGPVGKTFFPLVEKGKSTHRTYWLRVPRRGWFEFQGLDVITQFPFGFWKRSRAFNLPHRMLVLPKIHETWPPDNAGLFHEGEIRSKRIGQGEELINFRDFQNGDPIRAIHWKNTAKTDRLTVSVFHHPENRQALVVLRNTYPPTTDETFAERYEEAVSWAATAVTRLLQAGVLVGYLDNKTRIPPSTGDGHKIRILSHLALVELSWSREGETESFTPGTLADIEIINIEAVPSGVRISTSQAGLLVKGATRG